jgi:hypothetical protein
VKLMMIKFIAALIVTLALLSSFVEKSYSLDIYSMADQSTLRCWGGVVATGDSDSAVLKKCGQPQRVSKISGYGPKLYVMARSSLLALKQKVNLVGIILHQWVATLPSRHQSLIHKTMVTKSWENFHQQQSYSRSKKELLALDFQRQFI